MENIIKGNSEEEIWSQIKNQLTSENEMLDYTAVIEQEKRKVIIDIDIDLGGGFESGYATTTITAPLHTTPSFKFAIHREHFTDEIGKFFGMQDVEIGFDDFDPKFIVKTNDKDSVHKLFEDAAARITLESLDDFTFGITTHHAEDADKRDYYLEMVIEDGITDPQKLREIYRAFYSVLSVVDPAQN